MTLIATQHAAVTAPKTAYAAIRNAIPFASTLAKLDPDAAAQATDARPQAKSAHRGKPADTQTQQDGTTTTEPAQPVTPGVTPGASPLPTPLATIPLALPDPQPGSSPGGIPPGTTDATRRDPDITTDAGNGPAPSPPASTKGTGMDVRDAAAAPETATDPTTPPVTLTKSSDPAPAPTTKAPDASRASDPPADSGETVALVVGQAVPVQMPPPVIPSMTPSATPSTHDAAASSYTSASSAPVPQVTQAIMTLGSAPGQPGQIVLHLSPDTLGTVRVTLSQDAAGHTTVAFAVSEPETLHALAGDIGQLRHAVHEAGLGDHGAVEVTFHHAAIAPVAATNTDNTLSMSLDDRRQHDHRPGQTDGLNDSFTSGGDTSGGTDRGPSGQTARQNGAQNGTQRRARGGAMGVTDSVTAFASGRPAAPAIASGPVNITV